MERSRSIRWPSSGPLSLPLSESALRGSENWSRGRAFARCVTALNSTGQSLEKVKELLEETEREWLARHNAETAPDPSLKSPA